MISPFLNLDFPDGNKAQIFDLTKDLILNDSCPFKISISIFPFLVVVNLLFANLVKFFFFMKLFFKISLIGLSLFNPSPFAIYGKTKNRNQAADDIGFPGKPILFAKIQGKQKAIFGLPGNPMSSSACFRFFVYPYIANLLGL